MHERAKLGACAVATACTTMLVAAISFEVLGYVACPMCMWQRWAHVAAAVLASAALLSSRSRLPLPEILLKAVAVTMSVGAAIAVYHAGVEWKWWEGPATCTANVVAGSGDVLMDLARAPMSRCDEAAWRLGGVSMAGYNAILSFAIAAFAWRMGRVRTTESENERNGS